MATLHFICGKAASGKTTLARKLAAQHGAVVFIEDEWVTQLGWENPTLADQVLHTKLLRGVIKPLAIQILKAGTSIVFDFAGNTVIARGWVRSIFEAAGADHVLHVIDASDESCKKRLRHRNETKPEGLYFGHVTEERFDEVTRYFVPPAPEEKFNVVRYAAAAS